MEDRTSAAIDSLLTMGVGQQIGGFSGTAGGAGKSTLMSEFVMRCDADVTVVAPGG